MIKLSVVIPVYNVELYLEQCLQSIENQIFSNYEVIIVNDGSTDSSQLIIDKFVHKNSKFRSYTIKNNGSAAARNYGLKLSIGKYISFIDSDDYIDENMFLEMIEKIEDFEVDVVGCNYVNICGNSQSSLILNIDTSINNISSNDYVSLIRDYFVKDKIGVELWSKIYKTEVIKNGNLIIQDNSLVYGEDWLFNLSVFMLSTNIYLINKPFYFHRIRSGSLTQSYKPELTKKFMCLISKYKEFALVQNRQVEAKAVVPFIMYSLICQSMFICIEEQNGKILSGTEELKIAQKCGDFCLQMKILSQKKDACVSHRIFGWLCSKKFYNLAVIYRVYTSKLKFKIAHNG